MAMDGQDDGSKADRVAGSQPGTSADDQVGAASNAGPSPQATPPQPGDEPPPGYWPPPGYAPGAWPPPPGFGPPPGYAPGAWPPPPGFGPPPGYGPQAGYGYYAPSWPGVPVRLGPAPGLAYADMAVRFGALLIDAVILTIVVAVAGGIGEAFGIQHYANGDAYSAGAIAADLLGVVALIAYMPTFWWTFQGTPGQRALGLRVVRAADGQSLGIGATTIRYIIWLVCMSTVLLAVVAAIMASDKPSRQAWPDDVAGSVVVKRV